MEEQKKKTVNNLLEIAQKMADEKLAQEKQRVAEVIGNELSDVKKAVEMVRSGLCYSKRKGASGSQYVFATEEMLINDYLSEPENRYTRRGISFNNNSPKKCYDHIFVVNGIYYYDMRYILNKYEEDVAKEAARITRYNDQLNEMIREFERLLEERKDIKKMLSDWSERQSHEAQGGEVG